MNVDTYTAVMGAIATKEPSALLDSRTKESLLTIFLTASDKRMFSDVVDWLRARFDSPLGLFGYINREGHLVYPSRVEGHLPVFHSVGASIQYCGKLIGQIVVANRKTPYDEGDKALLLDICEFIAPLLSARLERAEVDSDLRRANEVLEKQILDRTAALRESEARFRTLVDYAPEAIVLFDPEEGTFVDANKNAERLFGWSREELLTMSPADISPEHQPDGRNSREIVPTRVGEAAGGDTPGFEWTHINKDGKEIATEVRLVRLASGGRTLIRGSVIDISERKRHEAEQDEYLRKLARSNAELEQFAYVASHDLRSPLRSIVNWVQILEKATKTPELCKPDEAIAFIQNSAFKAIKLIDDLMEMAKVDITTIPATSVDLNAIVSSVRKSLETEFQSRNPVIESATLPRLTGVPTYLESLFTNLLRNAIVYCPEERTPRIHIGFREVGEFCEFSVQDNALGIASKDQERIFGMFTRVHTDPVYPTGSGIGLAFCKKIVELCGGRIWVKSELGTGSTFSFTYPKVFCVKI